MSTKPIYVVGDLKNLTDIDKINKSIAKVADDLSTHGHLEATQNRSGFMSTTDKAKLDGIAENANNYSHPSYTARTGKPSENATPAFGGTFTVSQITSDSYGHVTGAVDRTITIPNSNFVKSGGGAKSGLVPAPPTTAGTTKYLREDGSWVVPPDTTYTSLKNPYALTIQGNGNTLTNGTYDGSSAKTVNITPSSIGASATDHTHTFLTVPDTRTTNQTPGWYFTNYPKMVVNEFKSSASIGLSGETYTLLTTYVPWAESSGGYPKQVAICNGVMKYRVGTSDTVWGEWKTISIDGHTHTAAALGVVTPDETFINSRGSIAEADLDTYTTKNSGTYKVQRSGDSTQLTVFRNPGASASGLEFYNDYGINTLKVRTSIDSNRYSAWKTISFSDHTHNYAGSSSAGGIANNAARLSNTSAIGSSTQPVYFNANGVPVATTYTLGASVPSGAKFTDTTYTSLKNPYALTIQGNGATLTNGTYDGSAAKTVNITPSSISAAALSQITIGAAASAVLTDSLLITTTASATDNNKPRLVTKDTSKSLPSDCLWGIRECYWHSTNNVTLIISGLDTNNKPGLWMNAYRSGWNGWIRLLSTDDVANANETKVWGKIPRIGATNGVMEIGKYLDFHPTADNTADYNVRVTASTTGLTISGTTSGTFSGSLSGTASTASKLASTGMTESTSITTAGTYALDARQNNASVSGTLAYKIAQLQAKFQTPKTVSGSFSASNSQGGSTGTLEIAINNGSTLYSFVKLKSLSGASYATIDNIRIFTRASGSTNTQYVHADWSGINCTVTVTFEVF